MKKYTLDLKELTEYFKRDVTMTLESNGISKATGNEMTLIISYNGKCLILERFVNDIKKEELELTEDKYELEIHINIADRPIVTLKDKASNKVLLDNVNFKSSDFFTE